MTSKRTVNYVFFTGTFTRDKELLPTWAGTNLSFNRYVQRLRRATHGNSVQYIRTVEAHSDDFPHIHAVLYFPQALIVENGRYFDQQLFTKLKELWTSGLSDYQPPSGTVYHSVHYIVKYITKNSTRLTLWRKLRPLKPSAIIKTAISAASVVGSTPTTPLPTIAACLTKEQTTNFFCKQFKIKQCTWSRGFVFPRLDRKILLPSSNLDKFN